MTVVSRYVELLCHEINNPLTIVYGQAALVKTQLEDAAPSLSLARERLQRVDQNTTRVVGLVRELREALREVPGEVAEVVALSDLLAQARVFNERWCRLKGGTVVFAPDTKGPLVCVRPVRTRGHLWRLMGQLLLAGGEVSVRTTTAEEWLSVFVGLKRSAASAAPFELDVPEWAAVWALDRVVVEPFTNGAESGLELRFPRVD